MAGGAERDEGRWTAWRNRVWAVGGDLANVEHALERPSGDTEPRELLASYAHVLNGASHTLAEVAREMGESRPERRP